MQGLIDSLDNDLQYAIEVEGKWQLEDAANYEEVRDAIKSELESLRDRPNREETPLIYHLDVAAMYPNIILTNRSALSRRPFLPALSASQDADELDSFTVICAKRAHALMSLSRF